MNTKGATGATIALFVVTILIVLLLLVFAFGSSFIRKLDNSESGWKVYSESEIGLNNLQNYMENFQEFIKLRSENKKELYNEK